jgi:hypothetical protein
MFQQIMLLKQQCMMKDGLQEAIALYLQNHTVGNYISTEYDNIVDWYIEHHDLVRWEDVLNA